ncbi:unnamed protein product [Ixodes hexagonus]
MESPPRHGRFNKFISCICTHCEILTPPDIRIRMERVKRTLRHDGVDLNRVCSAGPNTVCWLLDSLCPWNAILYKGGLGLHEEELGCLTCRTRAVPTSKERFGTEGSILEAAYLLYRLSQHRCLRRLVVKEPCPLRDRSYWGALLKLSLQASKGLRSVDVVSTLHKQGTCCVLDATPMACNLQEVKCSIHLSHEDSLTQILHPSRNILTELVLGYPTRIPTTEYLFSNLEFCTSLRRLELNVLEVDVDLFVQFMIHNKTITHLSVSQVFPTTTNLGDGVAYLIQVNRTLRVLHLRMRGGDATSIAGSMRANRTLRTLSLDGFENLALSVMAEVVILNNTLLELRLSARSLDVDVSEVAAAIVANKTLQKLCLRSLDVESTLLLVGALKHNSTLLCLSVGAAYGDHREEVLFKMAVLKPWALGRVVTKWDEKVCLNLAFALNFGVVATSLDISYAITELCFSFLKLESLCDSLRVNQSVRSLKLCVVPSCSVDESVSQKLGFALRHNETLESVKLSFADTSNGNTRLVCEGLKGNSSIFHLKVILRVSDPSALKYMAAVLEHNRVITSLHLNVESLLERRYLHTPRSVLDEWTDGWSSLSRVIEANRDLLEAYVSVKGPCVTGFVSDFALTVQRNLCALQQAVRFVLKPTTNKRAAGMFQDYENSRELLRRVDRSEATSHRGAHDLIQSAADFIACHFFVVTGIVQRTLQCEHANKSTVRLDDLNTACMCRIASFLRVSDVKG